jgi:glycosyltransferase involved in cell wall biosynthesis
MQIGIDVQPLQTGTREAGVGSYLRNLLEQLRRLQTDQTYHLLLNAADYLAPVTAGDPGWPRITVARKHRLGRYWWAWDRVYLPWLLHRHDLAVYHYNSLSETENMGCPRPFGKHRVVATIHDLNPLKFAAELEVPYRGRWYQEFCRKLRWAAAADAILTVSQASKTDIVNLLKYPAERVFVAYNGVAEHFFQEPSAEVRQAIQARYQLPEHFILYIGGYYAKRKNLDRLLQAYARLRAEMSTPQPVLVLAGISHPAQQAALDHLLAAYHLTAHTRCLPYIPEADLPGLYRLATLVVYPSLAEGFGLPVAEALACGAVVATAQTSSLPEVGGNACVYFDPYDPQSIAEMMQKALTNSQLRAALHQHGPPQVRQFSWSQTARQVVEVYQRVAQGM